jgi:transposase-like protein
MIGKKNASKRTSSGEDRPRFDRSKTGLKQADAGVNGCESGREHGLRIGETYVRVKGQGRDLYRALDSTGATIDFFLSAKRDAAAARRFLAQALAETNPSHPARVVNTGKPAA